jgi:putative transposase
MTQRQRYSAEFKARVALEALKGHKTVHAFAGTYGLPPTPMAQWKKHLERELPQLFASRRERREQEHEAVQAQLYQQIGPLKVEVDWLKKKLDLSPDAKRRLLAPAPPQISLARHCALWGVSRSSVYYHPRGERAENLPLRRLLDEQYTRTPFYGVRRMTAWLRQQGYAVNPKRVARLRHTLGLETI